MPSDLTAIGAVVVTVPSATYLLWPDPNKGHGHGHGGAEHDKHEGGEEHDESSEEGQQSEKEQEEDGEEADAPSSDSDSKVSGDDEGSSEDGSASSDSDGPSRPDHSVEDPGQGTPQTPQGEDPKKTGSYELPDGNNVEGVRFKGATSGGTKEGEQGDTRKHIPDAKGGAKHRIESHYGKEIGTLKDDDPPDTDKPAGSKQTGSPGTMTDKQHGLSNTQTKHSTDIDSDPNKSKKGEGMAETAKVQGTVDPQRPQV
ncbi:MAG: hypothetical protein Q9218_004433 [Villophora microphyllina]